MIVVLLIHHLSNAVKQGWVRFNLFEDCCLQGAIVNVKFDDNKITRLVYAADNVQGMAGLGKFLCYWAIIEVQSGMQQEYSLVESAYDPARASLLQIFSRDCFSATIINPT